MNFVNYWLYQLGDVLAVDGEALPVSTLGLARLNLGEGVRYALVLSEVLVQVGDPEFEVINIVGGAGGSYTLERGLEGTAAREWPAGTLIMAPLTVAGIEELRGAVGADGASAYQVAVDNGFEGNEAAWLASLVGEQGSAGAEGASAYQLAVANGFEGTEAEWLASLVGADGAGLVIIDELPSSGDLPATGNPGDGYLITGDLWLWVAGAWLNAGPIRGPAGKSAYEVAQASGFTGTEDEWLASLVGEPGSDGAEGASAYQVAVANGFEGTEAEWLASLAANALGLPSRTVSVSDTITPADTGRWIICTNSAPIDLSIGAEATASWVIPGILPMFHVLAVGGGAVTLAGDGFTISPAAGDTNVIDGYGHAVTALRRSADIWNLIGRTVAE